MLPFWHNEKVWTSVILGNSGFDSYRLQYTQKVHTNVRTCAILRKSIYNLSKIELLLNKAMLTFQYVLAFLRCQGQREVVKNLCAAKVQQIFYICKRKQKKEPRKTLFLSSKF